MKRSVLIILFIFGFNQLFSQVAKDTYRLYLKDKAFNKYSTSQPIHFLTQKAIDRRTKYQIEITQNDLPVSSIYLDSIRSLGFKIMNTSKWLNTVVVYSTDHQLLDTVASLGFIKSKQKTTKKVNTLTCNLSFRKNQKTALADRDDPLNYGYGTSQISMINGHSLHLNGFLGQGITIAVLDGGFYNTDILPAFDSLWHNDQVLGVKDFVDRDMEVFDASSHGMKVLSVMGSNIPGQLIGTAPKANYWLLRTEQTSTEFSVEEDNWVSAAEFADSVGCDIITSSLGYTEFDDPNQSYTYQDMNGNNTFITQAADIAASKGILVINSAGNLGDDPWTYISAPGDGDSVLTVGAVDAFASYAYFSGIGPTYDGRIKPNVAAMGYQAAIQGTNGEITTANGTSFSAPIIAGMAACLWQYFPEFNNMEIIKKIEESGHQFSNPDNKLGYGIPDFAKAAELSSTSTNGFIKDAMIKIYPNPFKNYVQIEILQKNKHHVKIAIINITGKKILEKHYPDMRYSVIEINNIGDLPPGIYLLKINIGDQVFQKNISKI